MHDLTNSSCDDSTEFATLVGSQEEMKDAFPRLGSSSISGYSLPFLCALAVVLAICLGLVTIPYLGFSPQLVIQEATVSSKKLEASSNDLLVLASSKENGTLDSASPAGGSVIDKSRDDSIKRAEGSMISQPTLGNGKDCQRRGVLHYCWWLVEDHAFGIRFSAERCDLFQGSWVYDPRGALYRNDSCPILTQAQNCQRNGRPDNEYEYWRWAPSGCNMPRFNASAFLQLMHGKLLAFVGDSVTRNQMESLMCILMQVETPINRGNRKMQRWFFPTHSVTIVRIWSSWLVRTSNEALENVPSGAAKLHIQQVDDKLAGFLPSVDVLVISSGHWFTKRAAYIIDNQVVGSQGWWQEGFSLRINNVAAFAICMKTALNAIVSDPNYRGLTILRTYSPDHYEGGTWNTGGSCTGKTRPLEDSQVFENRYTNLMRQLQLDAFMLAERNVSNESKLRLMDVTPAFAHRADGHPGPFRNQDPNKQTLRGPDGQPPPQDCLHWCMPGPIDTWNEFLLEILRQELQ